MKTQVDVDDENAIYQHIHRMTVDIFKLIKPNTDKELATAIMDKCESIVSMLYYLDDINRWMSKIKEKKNEGNDMG